MTRKKKTRFRLQIAKEDFVERTLFYASQHAEKPELWTPTRSPIQETNRTLRYEPFWQDLWRGSNRMACVVWKEETDELVYAHSRAKLSFSGLKDDGIELPSIADMLMDLIAKEISRVDESDLVLWGLAQGPLASVASHELSRRTVKS